MKSVNEKHFPFSGIEGQSGLQTALLLSAIDPMIGGVLIAGPKGTAKSTAARGLADLLDGAKLVNLPLAASEEQLIGSLNIESVINDGEVHFQPGLLAAADNGVLYVDEVNLLADHLVDALLDVSACGVNRVERDGISHQHSARFVLIGTMNPEEGELRPQLLDRFGLYLQMPDNIEPAIRQQIVKARLAFDADPDAFISHHEPEQQALRERLQQARSRLESIGFTDAVMNKVAELCYQAEVEGVRADLTLLRAARAHAVWQGHEAISDEDIDAVQSWVLGHRQKQRPMAASTAQRDGQEQQGENSGRSREGSSENGIEESGNIQGSDDWGAMPAQTPGIASVKPLKSLPVKK